MVARRGLVRCMYEAVFVVSVALVVFFRQVDVGDLLRLLLVRVLPAAPFGQVQLFVEVVCLSRVNLGVDCHGSEVISHNEDPCLTQAFICVDYGDPLRAGY